MLMLNNLLGAAQCDMLQDEHNPFLYHHQDIFPYIFLLSPFELNFYPIDKIHNS
jgi:hypothetical protein